MRSRDLAIVTASVDGSARLFLFATSRQEVPKPAAKELLIGSKLERYGEQRRTKGIRYGKVWAKWSTKPNVVVGNPKIGKPKKLDNLALLLEEADNQAKPKSKPDSRQKLLYFLHGVNNTFNDAALASLRIAQGSNYEHPVFFFSWPSHSWEVGTRYLPDIRELDYAQKYISESLRELSKRSSNERLLDVIAHSAGSLGMTRALSERYFSESKSPRLRHLVFGAPDLDVRLFKRDIARVPLAKLGTTVYVSKSDAALAASKLAWGETRLGATIEYFGPNVDTIRVHGQYHTEDRHQYIHKSQTVHKDLRQLFNLGKRAVDRKTLRKEGPIWAMIIGQDIENKKKKLGTLQRQFNKFLNATKEAVRSAVGLSDK